MTALNVHDLAALPGFGRARLLLDEAEAREANGGDLPVWRVTALVQAATSEAAIEALKSAALSDVEFTARKQRCDAGKTSEG